MYIRKIKLSAYEASLICKKKKKKPPVKIKKINERFDFSLNVLILKIKYVIAGST